ncbi:VWA domain-containing protein (plasmid) [Deinococcus radiomollis]|uniref:VWA domain-containing protein n=1 Tax=Deinococcus radiomollis TaxID=468916 RepID=UPI003892BD9A
MTTYIERPPLYPFAALVGQDSLRLALLLCATDPTLGVLLRGDKGAAKSTAARALAELLPAGAPFVNLPVGASEDRLLGGLDLEKALRGESALKPGLLAQAHGGVLYIDEVNLLPGHLIDALLDVAASGVNVLERDGFSEAHPASFVLLGSMNPEEGALRPQLLDRFALVAEVHAPLKLEERREILARRLAFDADPERFRTQWAGEQEALKSRLEQARAGLNGIRLLPKLLSEVAEAVCRHGVTSLRADLALVRAGRAHAALEGRAEVTPYDIEVTLPLVLAHRMPPGMPPPQAPEAQRPEPQNSESQPSQQEKQPPSPPSEAQDNHAADSESSESSPHMDSPETAQERVFAALPTQIPHLMVASRGQAGRQASQTGEARGRVIRSLPDPQPRELDLRASLTSALVRSGTGTLTRDDLHGRVREPVGGKLLILVIDASGSHAQQGRMGAVKGAALALLGTLSSTDRAAVIAFRGAQAELLCPPSQSAAARRALEYLPTGGRTPLAHALQLATELLDGADFTSGTLALFTDGRANVPTRTDNPWQDALSAAQTLRVTLPILDLQLIDTETGPRTLGRSQLLAEALGAVYSVLAPADGTA